MDNPLILGFGLTGASVAAYFESQKKKYLVYDDRNEFIDCAFYPSLNRIESIEAASFDLLIPSPGISPKHFIYQEAVKKGIPIRNEIDLAFEKIKCPIIAITGTNGKTTVTKLVAEMLQQVGYQAIPCGNFGKPVISLVNQIESDTILCVELSSFQLEALEQRKIDFGIILNLTPDHLDRYRSMQEYAEAKLKMERLIKPSGQFWIHSALYSQFLSHRPDSQVRFYDDQKIREFDQLTQNQREKENWMAAFSILREFDISIELFLNFLKTFKKPAHRVEKIAEIEEISFYDDSKGTNSDAVLYAIDSLNQPILLLLGGQDKGIHYEGLIPAIKKKVKQVILFGQAKNKLAQAFEGSVDFILTDRLEDAILEAYQKAEKGDAVLLSPACSSYDQFKNYEHRAKIFKECVLSLNVKD